MAPPGEKGAWKALGELSSIGLTLVLATVLGLGGGYYADRWLGTKPWLTLLGLGFTDKMIVRPGHPPHAPRPVAADDGPEGGDETSQGPGAPKPMASETNSTVHHTPKPPATP